MLVPILGCAPMASIPLPVLENFAFEHPDHDVWRVLSTTCDVGEVTQGHSLCLLHDRSCSQASICSQVNELLDSCAELVHAEVVTLSGSEEKIFTTGKVLDAVQSFESEEFELKEFVAALREAVREEVARLIGEPAEEISIDIEDAVKAQVCELVDRPSNRHSAASCLPL